MDDQDRTASLMTPAKLAQVKPKGPATPAAWLDQMAADAGHQHLRRIADLRTDLEAQAGRRDLSSVTAELSHLAETLPRLDFGLLQNRGWLARLSGKSKSAGTEFETQFEQIDGVAKALSVQAEALQARQGEQVTGNDLTLLELEVEYRAIEKILDQGARWLQDMRNQLKTREAAVTDDAGRQQIKDDAMRCEILVARLKALRAVSSAAQAAHQEAQQTAARRAGLVQMLQQALATDVKDWRARISKLASAAGDGDAPALSLEGPMESHRDLQLCVKQAIADCAQLQAHEKALAASLAALGAQLEAVAAA
jgi:hypothetical protein